MGYAEHRKVGDTSLFMVSTGLCRVNLSVDAAPVAPVAPIVAPNSCSASIVFSEELTGADLSYEGGGGLEVGEGC